VISLRRLILFSMSENNDPERPVPRLVRRLMPAASNTELREAAETFDQYMMVVLGIFERVKRERQEPDSPDSKIQDRVGNIHPGV
jgi:hypothetical protein